MTPRGPYLDDDRDRELREHLEVDVFHQPRIRRDEAGDEHRDREHEHSVEITASPIRGPDNSISGTVVVFHDVSEIRGLTRQMSYQATHDALTGLINRREFERRLQEAMDSAAADDGVHILCYMDLDRFKAVNDSCGHLAGDSMLREVAGLIKEQVRDSDFVGRLGGDEFGTLLIGCPLDKATQIAADICRAIDGYRFVWQDKIFNIGISVGLVEIGAGSGSLQDLLSAADSACYVAKQRGRGQVHVYSARDEAIAIVTKALDAEDDYDRDGIPAEARRGIRRNFQRRSRAGRAGRQVAKGASRHPSPLIAATRFRLRGAASGSQKAICRNGIFGF